MAPATVITADGRAAPHPSYIETAKAFIFERAIREKVLLSSEDAKVRLQSIAWIESVRKALRLPVRTFNTAAIYFHKFRLNHPDSTGHLDLAAAALFAACKIEDTLKKSKDILCAAYNLKLSASERLTTDNPIFEQHSKTIIGLERLMLEASAFDFRSRHPQRLLCKLSRQWGFLPATTGRTAYQMCLDLYRTFAPLKQTSSSLSVACVELTARLYDINVGQDTLDKTYRKLSTSRGEVMDTLLDLLDLYTHHKQHTLVGLEFPLDRFINIRISLNKEVDAHNPAPDTSRSYYSPSSSIEARGRGQEQKAKGENGAAKAYPSPRDPSPHSRPAAASRHQQRHKSPPPISPQKGRRPANNSPKDRNRPDSASDPTARNAPPTPTEQLSSRPGMKEGGTVRFMLDPQQALNEKEYVAGYFELEEEEYTVDVPVEDRKREEPRRYVEPRRDHRYRR